MTKTAQCVICGAAVKANGRWAMDRSKAEHVQECHKELNDSLELMTETYDTDPRYRGDSAYDGPLMVNIDYFFNRADYDAFNEYNAIRVENGAIQLI